jgi:alkanesulfonate monooxygenase SsuD/methylene tetrahydromethanopterin reductase-like flavin-dependent oxidoreductase (luciferase family)
VYTAEWLDIVRGLWEYGQFSFEGKHFTITEATAWPRPAQRPRPLLVNAGQSYTGMRFSAEQVDYAFTYPDNRQKFAQICAEIGRDVGFIGTKRIIMAPTDREAACLAREICDKADRAALRAHYIAAGAATEDTIGDRFTSQEDYDKYFLQDAFVGSPETVAGELARWVLEYRPHGVTLLFYNCIDDLSLFAEHGMPRLMKLLEEESFPLILI